MSYVGPSVVGTTFFNSMFEPSERGVLTVDPSSGEAGGHAYLIRAIVTDERRKKRIVGAPNNRDGVPLLRVRNSWGHGWGKAGDAYMWSDDYQKHLWPGGEQSVVTSALRAR
jgi:C1A family cysteine protease